MTRERGDSEEDEEDSSRMEGKEEEEERLRRVGEREREKKNYFHDAWSARNERKNQGMQTELIKPRRVYRLSQRICHSMASFVFVLSI